MNEFDILGVAADGMSAQQSAIGVFAKNVAMSNAGLPVATALEPTFAAAAQDGDEDDDFARLVASHGDDVFGSSASSSAEDAFPNVGDGDGPGERAPFVAMTGTRVAHGRADALGEMVAAMNAQRAFEANASVFELGKRLAERTIDVGNS